jgi:hypothetical protein
LSWKSPEERNLPKLFRKPAVLEYHSREQAVLAKCETKEISNMEPPRLPS